METHSLAQPALVCFQDKEETRVEIDVLSHRIFRRSAKKQIRIPPRDATVERRGVASPGSFERPGWFPEGSTRHARSPSWRAAPRSPRARRPCTAARDGPDVSARR